MMGLAIVTFCMDIAVDKQHAWLFMILGIAMSRWKPVQAGPSFRGVWRG